MAKLTFNKLKTTEAIWLPQVPEHWELLKVRHLFKESTKKGFPNETLLVASQQHGVVSKDAYGKRTVEATKDLHNLKLVEKGDFVISLRSFQGGIEVAHERGIISPAYTVMKETRQIEKRYFKNLFKSPPFISLMTLCVKGIREGQNIDYPTFKNEYLPFPPLEEQQAIATYLDKKNSEIDKFIRNKERLIELLEEESGSLRDSLIKDLPIEIWKKLKYIRRFRNGYAFKSDLFTAGEGYPVIRIGDIANELDLNTCAKYPVNQKVDKRYEVKNGDILIALSGATTGKVAQVDKLTDKAYLNQRVAKLDNGEPYLLLCLSSLIIQKQIILIADGSAQENISNKDIENLEIPFPKKETRDKIVTEFFQRNNPLKLAIEKAKKEISSIKEYREALITDLVTGKRSVPQLQMS